MLLSTLQSRKLFSHFIGSHSHADTILSIPILLYTILVHNTEKPQHSLVRVWCLNPKSMHDVYVHYLQSVVIALMHIAMVIYFL